MMLGAGTALALAAASLSSKIFGDQNISRHIRTQKRGYKPNRSIAMFNRHTGKAHEHKREIARRGKRTL